MVEAAFVTYFPIPPIYPYLPFTPGYLILKKFKKKWKSTSVSTTQMNIVTPLMELFLPFSFIFTLGTILGGMTQILSTLYISNTLNLQLTSCFQKIV